MPTYDYQCRKCGHITEVIHSMLEDGPSTCEQCGGELRRVLYPTGIIFRGSGFYKTDSRASGTGSTADTPAKTSTKGSDGTGPTTGGTAGSSGGGGESGSGASSGSSAPASPTTGEGG